VIWIEDGESPAGRVARTPRIGVGYAGTWALRPWRFLLHGSASTSGRRIHLRPKRERAIKSRE